MLKDSTAILCSNMSAVRSVAFGGGADGGPYLAAAEAADFVHLYDGSSQYTGKQEIDFFGISLALHCVHVCDV